MSESSGSEDLVRLLKAGDEDAARKLYDAYVDRLVAVARRRLSQRLASRVDPEDIVQSVYRTFFGRMKEGKFHIDDQDDLCKLLMRITVHKTLRQVAYHQAAKRDKGQEAGQGERSNEMLQQLLDEEPTPQTAVAFVDQLEHFLNRLRPEERQILEMRLQGYSNEEICKKLDIYDRKIRRVVERIRGLAEQDGMTPGARGLAVSDPERDPKPEVGDTSED